MPLPCNPPRLRGSSSGTMPRPCRLLTTVKPRSSSLRISAPAWRAPDPTHIIGRRARATRAASSSSSAAAGARGAGSGRVKLSSRAGRVIGTRCRSIGISTLTGPMGGVSACVTAVVSTPIVCSAARSLNASLLTEPSMPSWSYASCTVPTPRSAYFVAVWPVMCSTGSWRNGPQSGRPRRSRRRVRWRRRSRPGHRRRGHSRRPYARRPTRRAPS